MSDLEIVVDAMAELGEGPAWHARTQTLYWVDILGKLVHSLGGGHHVLQLDDHVGCIAPRADGRLVAGIGRSICALDPVAGTVEKLIDLEDEPPTNRINDGKCDPAGRFLAGTMDTQERDANGSLYSFSASGALSKLISGTRISNGLTWSPDHDTLYYIDTPTREVRAFDYDLQRGSIAFRQVVVSVPPELGWPDGMTSDSEGCLWIAMWGGSSVTRWDPAHGRLLATVPVPAPHVTACTFGGTDLDDLYITSARTGLDDAALRAFPHSGALFRVKTAHVGIPTFEFGAG